jgi:3-oxoacyl-[acyl-carrier protein] reductase
MMLNGKVSIITGGARGIGRKICEYFLKEGAITYIFDINESDGAEVLGKFKSNFGKDNVYFYKVDITNEDQVKKIIDEIAAAQQGIDILVNNAGITIDNLIMRMALEDWNKVIAVNLTGALLE